MQPSNMLYLHSDETVVEVGEYLSIKMPHRNIVPLSNTSRINDLYFGNRRRLFYYISNKVRSVI